MFAAHAHNGSPRKPLGPPFIAPWSPRSDRSSYENHSFHFIFHVVFHLILHDAHNPLHNSALKRATRSLTLVLTAAQTRTWSPRFPVQAEAEAARQNVPYARLQAWDPQRQQLTKFAEFWCVYDDYYHSSYNY